MNVNLNCVYSCTVKRRKPWRKLMWLGKMKEDLLLVDRHCFRLLSLPSGHTKRHIASLYSFRREIVSVGVSMQGLHLYLLLKTGDIIIWQKDEDSVRTVHGLPVFQAAKNQSFPLPEIWVSADAQQIVLVLGKSKIFLWRAFEVSLQDNLEGYWSSIPVDPEVLLPSVDCNVATVEVSFSSTSFITCAFVFAKNDAIHLTVGFLGFGSTVAWKETELPYLELGCGYSAVNRPGTLISRITVDGHLLALAVNSNAPDCARVVFFSLKSSHFQVSFLHEDHDDTHFAWRRKKRYCWVADMAWSVDEALLVCIMNNGCVCIMSRLGHPLCVTSCIHSTVDLLNLELFPLPFSKTLGKRRGISNKNDLFLSLSRQTFSLSTHCSAPLFVASDGHQVTVLQLPDFCCDSVCLVRSLCLFARESLQSLHNELLPQSSQESLHLISDFKECPRGIARGAQISLGPQSFDPDSGQIIPSAFVTRELRLVQLGNSTLIAAWGLIASMDTSWCEELDLLCRNIVWMTHAMFCILLGKKFDPKKWKLCATDFLCRCLDTVKFDRHFNMLSPTIKMVSSACRVMVDHTADLERLRNAFLLLSTAEISLLRIYSYASYNSCTASSDTFSLFCDTANYGSIVNRKFHPVICRLQSSWKRVYQQAFHCYQNGKLPLQFLCCIQRALQDRGYCLLCKRKEKKDITLLHFFSGYKMEAVRRWLRKDFSKHAQRKEAKSRRMHRILYALLSQGCINDSVELVYKFLFGERKKLSEKLFCVSAAVDDKDTRSLVASFSRFIALFLTENQLLLGLVGDPKPLPSLFSSEFFLHNQLGSRQTELLTDQGLDCMLLPNLTLELLLLAGLWTEASNFALKFGCWQMALVLAVLHLWLLGESNHHNLNPEFIIVSQLKDLYKDKLRMSSDRGLNDVHHTLFPAMICSIDPVPTFLNHLLDKLQSALGDWKLLVPPEIYLPAPPIFCPQPFVESQENCISENSSEVGRRRAVSEIVADVFAFIRATHLDVCLSSGYVHLLNVMWSALKLETNTLFGLNRMSKVFGEGLVSVWVPSLQQCLQLFRRFCSMLWFVNCRDQLSLACRLLQNHLLSCQTRLGKFCSLHTNLCCSILEWAICVVFVDGNATDALHTIVLNAVWDLPPTDTVVHLLAKYLARSKMYSSSLKHKISELTSRWNIQLSNEYSSGDSREFSGSSLLFRAINHEEIDKLEFHQKARDLVEEELGPTAADSGYEFFETSSSYVVFLESVLQIGLMKHMKLGIEQVPYLVHYWHEQLSPKYIVNFSSAVRALKSYRQESLVLGFDLLSIFAKDLKWKELHKRESVLFHRKTQIEKQRHTCEKSLQRSVNFQNAPELLKRKGNANIYELQNSLPEASHKLCSKSEEIVQLLADLLSPKLKSLVCVYTSLHKWLCDEAAYGNSTVLSLLSPSIVLFLMVNSLHKEMPIPKREDITDRGFSEIALDSIDPDGKEILLKEEKLSADVPVFIEVNSARIESVAMPGVEKMSVNCRIRELSETNALCVKQNTDTSTFVERLEPSDTARIRHFLKAKNFSNGELRSGKLFSEDALLPKSRPLEESGIHRRASSLPQVYVEQWSNRLLVKDKGLPDSVDNCTIPEVVLFSPLNRESLTVVKTKELLVKPTEDCIQDVSEDITEVNALCVNSLEDSIQDLKEDIREVRSNCQLANDMQESFRAELKRMAKQLNLVHIGKESDTVRGTLQVAATQTCSDIPSVYPPPTFLQMELVDQKALSNYQLRNENDFPLLKLNVPSAAQQETIINNMDFCFHDKCPDKLLIVPDLNKYVEKPKMLKVDVYPAVKQLFLVSPLKLKELVEPHFNKFVTQCPELSNSEFTKPSVEKLEESVTKTTEMEGQETPLLMKTSTNDDIIEVFPVADPVEKLARPASRLLGQDCEFESYSNIQYKVHNVTSKSNTRYMQTTASAQTKLITTSSDAETSTDNLLQPGREDPQSHLEFETPNATLISCPRIVTVDNEANLHEQLPTSTHLTCSIPEERGSEAYKSTMTEKLKSMQKQLETIENITSEVEREFVAAEELLKEAAELTAQSDCTVLTDTMNENKGPIFSHQKGTLHLQMTDADRKGRRQTMRRSNFEIRKRAVLDVLEEEHPLPKSGGRRISFGSTHTVIFPRSDSSAYESRTDLRGDSTGSCQRDKNARSSLKVFR